VAIRGVDPLKEQIVTTLQEAQQTLMAVFLVPSMLLGILLMVFRDQVRRFWDSRFHANTSHRHGCSGCGLPGFTLGSNGPFPADAVDSGLTKWEIRVYDRIPTSWI